MAKKVTKKSAGADKKADAAATPEAEAGTTVVVDLTREPIKSAVANGLALIKEGKSKADAARAIFAVIGKEPKEAIVAAFVAGANLTEKGAMTYWYNCKRKAGKAAKAAD